MTQAKANWRPHFDADEMSAANVPPTIRIGSFTYTGHLFSALEWLAWNEKLQALRAVIESGTVEGTEILRFYHAFFRATFPLGWFRPGVPFWAPDVADSLLEEPTAVIEEAFERFFDRQALANGVPRKSPSTSGTESSASTRGAKPAAVA